MDNDLESACEPSVPLTPVSGKHAEALETLEKNSANNQASPKSACQSQLTKISPDRDAYQDQGSYQHEDKEPEDMRAYNEEVDFVNYPHRTNFAFDPLDRSPSLTGLSQYAWSPRQSEDGNDTVPESLELQRNRGNFLKCFL